MNPAPTLPGWWQLLGLLAVQVAVVVGLAVLIQRFTRSAVWQRTIWQVCTLGLLTLVACELSGLSRGVIGWAMAKTESGRTASTQVTTESSPVAVIPEPTNLETAESVETAISAPISFPEPLPQPTFAWWPGLIWLLGTVLVAGWTVFARLWFLLCGRRRHKVTDDFWLSRVQSLARRLRIRRRIRLTELPGLSGPIAFGILWPAISLPEGFRKRFTEAQQDAMIVHELAHLAARDPAWYWLADMMTALLWWHPLAWWVRRQLHAASEAAADEASLLIENGPDVLAECLVELGHHLTQPQPYGWLGIEGSGFRSGLGRRVKRLVALRGQPWKPMRRTNAWLAKTTGPLALVALVLASTAWTLPRQKEHGTMSQAFQESIFGLALFAVLPEEQVRRAEPSQSEVSKLLLQAKALWEAGNMAEAEAKVKEALKLDPGNEAAQKHFSIVQKMQDLDLGDQATSHIIRIAASPAEAESMLEQLLKLQAENRRAYYQLSLFYSTNRQPPPKDILLHPTNPPKEVIPGALGTDSARKQMPTNDSLLYPTLPPKAVIAGASETKSTSESNSTESDRGQDAVARNGVVITSKYPEPIALYTRWFKIDPGTFLQRLQSETNPDWGSGSFATVTRSQRIIEIARDIFSAAGVDFGPPADTGSLHPAPGKALFFNDRLGMLMVRATAQDLEIIEQTISALKLQLQPNSEKKSESKDLDFTLVLKKALLGVSETKSTSESNSNDSDGGQLDEARKRSSDHVRKDPLDPVALHHRWFKVDLETLSRDVREKLGTNAAPASTHWHETLLTDMRRFLTSFNVDLSPPKALFFSGVFSGTFGRLMVRATPQDLDAVARAMQILTAGPQQFTIEVKVAEVTEEDRKVLGLNLPLNNMTNGWNLREKTTSMNGPLIAPARILTDPQYQIFVRALKQRPGVDLWSVPKVWTLSGRQAQVIIPDLGKAVSGTNYAIRVESIVTPNVIVEPFVLDPVIVDGCTIQLIVTGSVKEFLGYETGSHPNSPTDTAPTPVFQNRQFVGSANVYDGQTLLIDSGSVTSQQKTARKVQVKRSQLIFLTPRLVDPAGNPLHADEDIQKYLYRIPPE